MIIPVPSLDKWQLSADTHLVKLPDDTNAIQAQGSTFSVDLGITPHRVQADPNHPQPGYALDGIYQLTFSVANALPSYPSGYDIEISYGTQQLFECYGWGTAIFSQITVNFPSPHYLIIYHAMPGGGPPQGENNLVINGAESGGWPLLFKDVSLTFTPQP